MKTVLFDMDGTLHYMDQDKFTKEYFGNLCAYFAPKGYDPEKLAKGVVKGTYAMAANDGSKTNKDVFWQTFAEFFGGDVCSHTEFFEEFYINEFNKAKDTCHPFDGADGLIKSLKAKGYKIVLATNPVFPMIAHYNRIKWANLDKDDFDYITSYENSHFCKPNPLYYKEILEVTGTKAEDAVMVGNDVTEDMAAEKAGIKTYLVTDCLINRKNEDISKYLNGSFEEMANYLKNL
ncbi:MAG: HAD family hydrolase [Clostridia bacterium]|nr:HAD family hydrolase [Clostridia bacterium]